MNQLSWLLYLGNVAENVGILFFLLGIAVFCWAIVQACMYAETISSARYMDKEAQEAFSKDLRWRVPGISLTVVLAALIWLAAAFCPSSTTVYAIAASQMGEQALKTPVVGKAGQALEAWLNKQIKDNTKAGE